MGKAKIVELTWPMDVRSCNWWARGLTRGARMERARVTKEQRQFAEACIKSQSQRLPQPPYLITLTRLYGLNRQLKRELKWDDDSIVRGFKAIQDGIADGLGINDGDESMVTWIYGPQEKSPRSGVRIRIERRR